MKYGFIFLHRQIKDHWIWNDPIKLKWWLDILFYVNFENKKVNIGNQIFECNRGQSIMSLQNWAIRWNATKGKARSFLELLQKDNMITLENLTKTTRLTVCNYELYQSAAHADETLTKRKQNAGETLTDTTKEREESKEKEEATWKTDFEIYKLSLKTELEKFLLDGAAISKQEGYHPNIDIPMSLKKAVDEYWGTEEGWDRKRKKKPVPDVIDWRKTLTNALSLRSNLVWKSWDTAKKGAKVEEHPIYKDLTSEFKRNG